MNTFKKQPAHLYELVILHYLFSGFCLLGLSVMLIFASNDLLGHYFHPHLLAITHLAALGWGTTIIFGACYQLIPVVFETALSSYKLAWISFVLFATGIVLLVYAFWVFDPGLLMQTGGSLILIAVLLFGINVILTARSNIKASSICQEFIVTSSIWLFATALLGLFLVFNFRYAFLPQGQLHFLKLHAHMGIVGWFMLLIIGVSSKLIPMFLVSRKTNEKLLNWSYYLINLGLLCFLVDGFLFGLNYKTYAIAGITFSGLAIYIWYVVECFQSRLKKRIELPITNTIGSFVLLIAATLVLPFIIYLHLQSDQSAVFYSNLYGALLFMGWISALILGQTFKTLPFIVWAKKYEHLAGKVKMPLPADLYKNGLLRTQTLAYVVFCLGFFFGLLLKSKILICAGLFFLLITSLAYVLNVLFVVFHKSQLK